MASKIWLTLQQKCIAKTDADAAATAVLVIVITAFNIS